MKQGHQQSPPPVDAADLVTKAYGDANYATGVAPDYLTAALTANQVTNLAVGNHIEFNASSRRGTSIALAAGGGQASGLFTLQPGKTYEIISHAMGVTNEGHAWFQWTDDLDDSPLVDDTGVVAPTCHVCDQGTSVSGDNTTMSVSVIVFTPLIETTIKLDVTISTNLTRWDTACRVLIKEL